MISESSVLNRNVNRTRSWIIWEAYDNTTSPITIKVDIRFSCVVTLTAIGHASTRKQPLCVHTITTFVFAQHINAVSKTRVNNLFVSWLVREFAFLHHNRSGQHLLPTTYFLYQPNNFSIFLEAKRETNPDNRQNIHETKTCKLSQKAKQQQHFCISKECQRLLPIYSRRQLAPELL